MKANESKRSILKALGPGLLYAGAAIGVSHLVQSTRAGADFGYGLVWAVLIANVLKFPFFEFGPRYAAATGKTLLHGYKNLGFGAIITFGVLTLATMFVIQAAVTIVTAGLASELFGTNMELWQWSAILLTICGALIVIGRYSILDKAIKVIIITLTVSTIVALCFAFGNDAPKPGPFASFDITNVAHFGFLIALMGWMPAPLDISVWHSVWSVSKNKGAHGRETLRTSLIDFRIGYWGTAILALGFLSLGALMMYGTGEPIPTKAGPFAKKLIDVYTSSLGDWSYWLIGIAAFTTMFSTTLTCLDAFPRVLAPATRILIQKDSEDADADAKPGNLGRVWLLITILGTLGILIFAVSSMTALIDFITVISFLATPIFAVMNYMVVFGPTFFGKPLAEEFRPSKFTQVLSWVGILFLTGFSIYYLIFYFST